jgi:hypothetical protein
MESERYSKAKNTLFDVEGDLIYHIAEISN